MRTNLLSTVGLLVVVCWLSAGCGSDPPEPAPGKQPAPKSKKTSQAPDAAAASLTGEVNLLQKFNIREHTSRGAAALSGEGLRFTNPAGACQVHFPGFQPPEQYDVEAEITRSEGSGAFILGLFAWGQQCRIVIDGETDEGPRSGLCPINGKWLNQPGYDAGVKGPVLTNGRRSKLICQIRRDCLVVLCDGRSIADYRGNVPELGKLKFYTIAAPRAFSAASWKSKFLVHRLVVRPPATLLSATAGVNSEPETGVPPVRELSLDADNWAFTYPPLRSVKRRIVDPRTELKRDERGLRAQVRRSLQTMHLVYRPRLTGDYQIWLQIRVPSRDDPDSLQSGGTAIPYVGFRPLETDGRLATFPVPSPSEHPETHEFQFVRRGDTLTAHVDGKPLRTDQSRVADQCHLYVQLNGPAKAWIIGHAVDGDLGPEDYAQPEWEPLELTPQSWHLSRPSRQPEGQGTATLTQEDGGLRVVNSVNQPLQLSFHQPLRGDFHVVTLVQLLSRTLQRKTLGPLEYLAVSAGFHETGKRDPTLLQLTKFRDADGCRVDIVRQQGELLVLADGRRCGTLRNAADGQIVLELQQAGSIQLGDASIEADSLLAPVAPVAPAESPPPEHPLRTWTDATGQFRVPAKLVRLEGDVVHLEDEQGTPRSVPLDRLSEPDQQYVRQQQAAGSSEKASLMPD